MYVITVNLEFLKVTFTLVYLHFVLLTVALAQLNIYLRNGSTSLLSFNIFRIKPDRIFSCTAPSIIILPFLSSLILTLF